MTIKPKYDLGDTIYFLDNRSPKKAKIKEIHIHIKKDKTDILYTPDNNLLPSRLEAYIFTDIESLLNKIKKDLE